MYEVAVMKPVEDILRTFVWVEADSKAEAEAKALALEIPEESFVFWQCGDSDKPQTAEATEVHAKGG